MTPYEFTGDYSEVFTDPEMAMDPRHIYALFHVLSRGGFKYALEIGSGHGASSTAFVESVKHDPKLRTVLCDPWVGQSLSKVVSHAGERVRFFRGRSVDVLDATLGKIAWDFVLVDGRHDLESVSGEIARLELFSPRCIFAHDTNATETGRPLCEGALKLKLTLQEAGWTVIEDAEFRLGEMTDRGLMAATREPELADLIREAFEQYCPATLQEVG